MSANFMTYQYALQFDRYCRCIQLESEEKEKLLRVTTGLVHRLAEGFIFSTPLEGWANRNFATGLLRECAKILADNDAISQEVQELIERIDFRLKES